jgi:hypothetical protein
MRCGWLDHAVERLFPARCRSGLACQESPTKGRSAPVLAAVHRDPALAAVHRDPALAAVRRDPVLAAVRRDPVLAAVRRDPVLAAVRRDPALAAVRRDPVLAAVRRDPVLAAVRRDPVLAAVRRDPVLLLSGPMVTCEFLLDIGSGLLIAFGFLINHSLRTKFVPMPQKFAAWFDPAVKVIRSGAVGYTGLVELIQRVQGRNP